jgi:hypothetical protein
VNWNLLGDGLHRVRAFADGVQFADVTFTVTVLGGEFLTDRSGGCLISNFPQSGTSVTVAWQESLQNFVIVGTCPTTDLRCQGAAALALGDFHEAEQRLSQAVAANPQDEQANLALALTAALQGLRAALDLGAAYHVDIPLAVALQGTGQQILAAAPSFLTLRSAGALSTARDFASQALTNFSAAITAIQAETDDQSDDLLMITPADSAAAQRSKQIVDLLRQSLQGQVVFPTSVGLPAPERLNLSPLFSAQFNTLRPVLPGLDGAGNFDLHHFPDPTFAGMAPDVTQQDIDIGLEVLTAYFWSLY